MGENSDHAQIRHIRDLTPDPHNARAHPQRNLQMISDSLQEVGVGRSILIDENGRILAGNGVVEAGGQIGLEDVVVIQSNGKQIVAIQRTDLTEDQKTRIALYDNRTAELAEWDVPVLKVMEQDGQLTGLFTQDELTALWEGDYQEPELLEPGGGGTDFDETPLPTDNRVKSGDLWQIGPHRLYCGDSRNELTYKRLMGESRAELMFTDPPYGVSYAAAANKTRGNNYRINIENDDLRGEALYDFLMASFGAADPFIRPAGALYIFHADGPYGTRLQYERAVQDTGWHLSATLIWVKNLAGYGYADYRAKHEPIMYGWTDGGEHYFVDDHSQTTEWRFDKDSVHEYVHPNQKPVELIERALRNSSKTGEIALDPFAGGGPLLVAAHRTQRQARLIDKDPEFCSVILRRAELEGIGPIERVTNYSED